MATEFWQVACHVLNEAGRARVHKLRNSLNAVALGVELLGEPGGGPPAAAGPTNRGVERIRQQIAEAAADIDGLHALVGETTHPDLTQLSDALSWSVDVARPVAERRNVALIVPHPVEDLPPIEVPRGFSVAFGEFLLAACLTSDRRQRCVVDARADSPVHLAVEWRPGEDHDEAWFDSACRVMTDLLEPEAHCELALENGIRQLVVRFA